MQHDAFRTYVTNALEDDHLTEGEEHRVYALAGALGFDQAAFQEACGDLMARLIVARANDGRLGIVANPRLTLKRNEVAHLQVDAELLKVETVKEWQSGSAGVSFRVMKGVRFSTSRTRGRTVVVGSQVVTADVGTLVVSSLRLVYLGTQRNIEVPYPKLLNMDVFDDGIRLHVSGRSTAPMLRVGDGYGNVVAATLNAAMQTDLG